MIRKLLATAGILAAIALPGSAFATTSQYGPTPYLQFSDSPFASIDFSGGYFYLETFEDHLLNVPGVTADSGGVTSVVFGPAIHDSVDADDGVIDGSGLNGDSYFSGCGGCGVTFTFDKNALGELPTYAGMVWTDGAGTISFEAFDENGVSLGVNGPNNHADGSVNGETAEDRFYGTFNSGGISAIKLLNTAGGIELDHLQYGITGPSSIVAEPATWSLMILAFAALGFASHRRRTTA